MEYKTYDYIVVGSGLAGLSFALRASQTSRVLILTKGSRRQGSTGRAQGGIATVMSPNDTLENHVQDTLVAGAGLCREDRVRTLVSEGPRAIERLIDWGVKFSKENPQDKQFHLSKEGGHSDSRILHSEDWTGREILRALLLATETNPNIEINEYSMGIDLVLNKHLVKNTLSQERCHGVYVLNLQKKQIEMLLARAVILCTGGVGQVYANTTNDAVSTGDGIAMAYRAGALIEDMEFIQFHPTSFYDPGHPTFLISEALRGHGGKLVNHLGENFMTQVHPLAELAPRDIVARAIDAEMKKYGQNSVFLDMTQFGKSELVEHFPNIFQHCFKRGIDISKDRIPVVPAAHFLCGGVSTNENARTSISRLYACGETACNGVHGANRLASNSLLEAVVYSEQALKDLEKLLPSMPNPQDFKPWDSSKVVPSPELSVYSAARETLQNTLWNYVGIVRNNLRLRRAQELISVIYQQSEEDYWGRTLNPQLIELRNLVVNAMLIITSAQNRLESRGLHYNLDYPQTLPMAQHTLLRKQSNQMIPQWVNEHSISF